MSNHEAKVVTQVAASPARVFRTLTSNLEQAAIAGGAASIDPVAGGAAQWVGGRLGHVTATIHEIVQDRRVVFLVDALAWLDGWGLGPLERPSRLEMAVDPGDGAASA